jgi:MFS family permease
MSKRETFLFVAVVLFGAIVRIYLAANTFPAQRDASHFVQHGIEYAGGNKAAMTGMWSQAQILAAAWAFELGFSPERMVQIVSVFFGIWMVPMTILFVWRFFHSMNMGVIAGLLVASNPSLILYSVNGMANVPYGSLVMTAAALLACSFNHNRVFYLNIPLAFIILAPAIYYRSIETLASALVLGSWTLYQTVARRDAKSFIHLVVAGLLFMVITMPNFIMTSKQYKGSSLSPKMMNLVIDPESINSSKSVRDPDHVMMVKARQLEEIGAFRFMWEHREVMLKRVVPNVLKGLRSLNEVAFHASLRLGMDWFLVLLLASFVQLPRPIQWDRWLVVLGLMFFFPLMISIAYIVSEWFVAYVPFLFIFFSASLSSSWKNNGLAARIALATFLIFTAGRSSLYAVTEFADDWKYQNEIHAATVLRAHGSEEDILMSGGPLAANTFYDHYPLRWKPFTYGTIEEMDEMAGKRSVTLIMLSSDEFTRSWPVQKLFEGESSPPNWQLLERLEYNRNHPKYGPQQVVRLLYRRHATAGADR